MQGEVHTLCPLTWKGQGYGNERKGIDGIVLEGGIEMKYIIILIKFAVFLITFPILIIMSIIFVILEMIRSILRI